MGACLALLLLCSASSARPREGTVAIVQLEIAGDGAPELRPQLLKSLAGGLATGGVRVITLKDVLTALADTPELIGCTSTTCLARIGEKLGADYFVTGRVEATGSAYTIELQLLSAVVEGALVTRVERSCPVCTIMEVNDMVSEAARDLVVLPPAQPVPVMIATEPVGARVFVDEVEVGTSPFEGMLEPGDHKVSAALEGYHRAEKAIRVSDSDSGQQRFELVLARDEVTDVPPPPPDRRRPYKTWKWVTAGGAFVALGAGVTLIAIDGNDLDCERMPGQEVCPEERNTLVGGLLSVAAGVGLGGVSGWMFVRDREHARRTEVSVEPTPGGASATFILRF